LRNGEVANGGYFPFSPAKETSMRTRVNINFNLLCHSIMLGVFIAGCGGSLAYLCHLLLSALFYSQPIFFSIFGLVVTLVVLCVYDAKAFQWDNHPRIAIVQEREEIDDEE
jgi:hypothetical protein